MRFVIEVDREPEDARNLLDSVAEPVPGDKLFEVVGTVNVGSEAGKAREAREALAELATLDNRDGDEDRLSPRERTALEIVRRRVEELAEGVTAA